jgi:uncharacterized protein (UPF0333 family)
MKKLYQKGSAAIIALVSILVVIVLAAVFCFMSYVSAHNFAVGIEAQLKAAKANNENILAQYGQKLQESTQVPDMARDDIVKVVKAAIEGRYGDNGSQAAIQVLREQNPNVDPQLYRTIQAMIESGRDEFKQGQTKILDIIRNYETNLGYFWRGLMLRTAGFPKLNLDDYKIVSTDRAQEAFKNGKERAPIRLRAEPVPYYPQ